MPDQTTDASLSLVTTTLMKGPIYRDQHEKVWRQLLQLRSQVDDYARVIGLTAVIDEVEGFAFLKSLPNSGDDDAPPRLVPRRALSYQVSLLLALLRKRLAEFDATGGQSRLVLTRDEVANLLQTFLPVGTNEVRLVDEVDASINKAVDLGFLRRLPSAETTFEVRRILKAFVDAQWLADFDQRLAEYAALAGGAEEVS